jgi:hypothetical protein
MTPEKLIESKERAKLQKMKSRLGVSHDEKAKRKQCLKMTPEKLIESKERAKLHKMKSRLGMSHDEKAKREKAQNTMNRLRDSMSPDEKGQRKGGSKEYNA